MYFADTKNSGVTAVGIITGSTRECPSKNARNHWVTELHGICRWAGVSGQQVGFRLDPSVVKTNGTRRMC